MQHRATAVCILATLRRRYSRDYCTGTTLAFINEVGVDSRQKANSGFRTRLTQHADCPTWCSTRRLFSISPSTSANAIPISNDQISTQKKRTYTKYEALVRRLYMTNLYHPVKLGLENMEQLNEALERPLEQGDIKIIHVAGSNGKGSTSYKIAKSLQLSGLRTGLFVSPHVSSFRERMQVDFEPISEAGVEELLPEIFRVCEERGIRATFFEITTALAFKYFSERKVDAIVLEVGLGGRLDSTNIVTPTLSVITSIGLEHTRILGDTIEEIAVEKAGIVKDGKPVIIGPCVPRDVVYNIARDRNADFYTSDELTPKWSKDTEEDDEESSSAVDFDEENSRIATAALTLLQRMNAVDIRAEHMKEGIAQRPPCRFEQTTICTNTNETTISGESSKFADIEVEVVLDVAHNPSAFKQLVSKLEMNYPNKSKRMVIGFSRDKDIQKCIEYIFSAVKSSGIHLVQAAHPRAATLEQIIEAAPSLIEGAHQDVSDRSITSQVRKALKLAAEQDEVLVVCGSVFLMAEAREALGYNEARDSDHISEVAGVNLRHGQEHFADSNPDAPFAWDEHLKIEDDNRASISKSSK